MQSLTKRRNTFSVSLSPDAPGCENRCHDDTYIDFIYLVSPGLCHFFVLQFQNRISVPDLTPQWARKNIFSPYFL